MNPERPTGVEIQDVLHNAVTEAMKQFDKSFVIKWVAAVEVMQDDGERGVWTFTSPDATRWDINGLVQEMAETQTGHNIAHIIMAHGDGGGH